MTSPSLENFLRYKKNTAGNNFLLGLKWKSELVYTPLVPRKNSSEELQGISQQISNCMHATDCSRGKADSGLVGRQISYLSGTDSVTALHRHTLSLYKHLYIAHETAVCCNAHNSSNWDTRFTRHIGYNHTFCQNAVFTRKRLSFSEKKKNTTYLRDDLLSICQALIFILQNFVSVCLSVTTDRRSYCTHNRN